MESWDIYDSDGNLTGRTATRGDPLAPGEYHLGVSLWIVNLRGELLIQRRAPTKRIWPGLWSITGGAAIAGETSRVGCVREVFEELGVALGEDEIEFLTRRYGGDIIFDDYILIRDIPLDSLTLQAEEVAEARYAAVSEIRALFREGKFLLSDMSELDEIESYLKAHGLPGY